MTSAANTTFNEQQYVALKNSLPPVEYEAFISFQKNKAEFEKHKQYQRLEKRKKDAGQDYFTTKDRLIIRYVKKNKLEDEAAPDDSVLAYIDIKNLKKNEREEKGTLEEKSKIAVSNSEIKAFRFLEENGHYYKDITLAMVGDQVKAMKDTGGTGAGPEDDSDSSGQEDDQD